MARRRRYNPNQKRARNGQWTKAAGLSTGAVTPAGGGTYKSAKQRRYEGYQKHLAQQAEIQAANKKKAARRKAIAGAALGAAAVGAIGIAGVRRRNSSTATVTPIRKDDSVRVGRPASRTSSSPLGMHNANIAKETPSPKVNLVRDMPKAKPVKVAAGPNKMAAPLAGNKASAPKKAAQNKAGVQNPTPHKTVPPSVAKVQRGGSKAKGDAPPRSEEVLILKANSKERKDIRQRRNEDIRKMNETLRQKGLIINDLSGRRITDATATKRDAAREREQKRAQAKRDANAHDPWAANRKLSREWAEARKMKATRRARAEERYLNIIQNAQLSGKKLNRTQRKYLSDLGL